MEIIITTLIWAAVFQGFLLGFIFIFSKKHKSFSNKLLGLFLIAFIFGAISDLIPFDFIGKYNIAQLFSSPEVKMLFPVLFLHYVLEKIGRSEHFKIFLNTMYIIACGILSITVINIAIFVIGKITIYDIFESGSIESFYMFQQYLAYLLTIVAVVISIVELVKFQNMARNEYSDITMLSINWLWQFVLIFIPVVSLWGAELIRILTGGLGQSDIVYIIWGIVSIIIYIVSYKAFTQQDLFYPKAETIEKQARKAISDEDKSKSSNTICESVKNAMETGQYYLNQDLSIHDFAKEINISARTISTCINKSFGFNFNEWVNNYRVEKALDILNDKTNDHLSIEGIGLDSGFKSRSAMYIAFKKKTGKTPGNFRNN
ncbi:AraC family transcriptional regulator [Draconibacterium sediminis]|uniref:helix-turn-helix domain-containing protein n=1 Tax=Draconibacterium sediminis TaxID=1544798 RepID=UPI0026EC1B74|nr:helix-turn-helix domain-containing protein [Draconibacterium sediminis]